MNPVNKILGKDVSKNRTNSNDYNSTHSLVVAVNQKYPNRPLKEIAAKVNFIGKYGTMQNQANKLTASDIEKYLKIPGYKHDEF